MTWAVDGGRRATVEATIGAIAARGLATSARAPGEPLDDHVWYPLLEEAQQQKLLRFLRAAVEDGLVPTTSSQRVEVGLLELQVDIAARRLEELLLRAVELLGAKGIEHRVLKGAAVANLAYREPHLRYWNDVDLLVPSTDFDAAVAILVGDGGVRARPEVRPGFLSRFGKGVGVRFGPFNIDLHRTFASGPPGLLIDERDLLASPQPFEIAGERLLGLGREALLLHACYHAFTMQTPYRVVAHRDVVEAQRVLSDGGAGAVIEMAARWSGRGILAASVLAADRRFDVVQPSVLAAWAQGHRPPARERRTADGARPGSSRSAAGQLLDTARAIPGASARVAYLRGQLFPSREYRTFKGTGLGGRWRAGLGSLGGSLRRPAGAGQRIDHRTGGTS